MQTEDSNRGTALSGQDESAHRLLAEIAAICALASISEEAAVASLRDGFKSTAARESTSRQQQIDPVSASQVISEWHENVRFLRSDGEPAGLSIARGEFAQLCHAAAADLNPTDALAFLKDTAVVEQHGDIVSAKRRDVIVGEGHPSGAGRGLRILGNFATTIRRNLTRSQGDPGRFERSVSTAELSPRQLPALIAYLGMHGQSFLEDLDSWMTARRSDGAKSNVGVGVYLFVED